MHEARRLSRRRARRGLRERERGLAVGSRQSAGDWVRVVTELHAVDLLCVAVQRQVLERHGRRFERRLRTDGDPVALWVLAGPVQRPRARHADAAALTDGEAVLAAVLAHRPAALVDDLA